MCGSRTTLDLISFMTGVATLLSQFLSTFAIAGLFLIATILSLFEAFYCMELPSSAKIDLTEPSENYRLSRGVRC